MRSLGLKKNESQENKREIHLIDKQNWYRQDSKIRVKLHQLKEENEQLDNRVKDLEELNRIYVDFLVCEGYELADVMKGDVE